MNLNSQFLELKNLFNELLQTGNYSKTQRLCEKR